MDYAVAYELRRSAPEAKLCSERTCRAEQRKSTAILQTRRQNSLKGQSQAAEAEF